MMSTVKSVSRVLVFLCCVSMNYSCGNDPSGVDEPGVIVQNLGEGEGRTCGVDEHVQNHACVPCAQGLSNVAGDDASGVDTVCDDACSSVLGVSCQDFEQAYVKSSNNDAYDAFGHSVSLYEDTLVVGAINESSDSKGIDKDDRNNAAPGTGAVYVFTRDKDSRWAQQAYIKASNAGGFFGSSVSLYEDTLVVGAPGEGSDAVADDRNVTGIHGDQDNNDAPQSGAVYVFTRDKDSTWAQQAYIKASNADVDDVFGAQVSLYEDTLVISAPLEDSEATGINGSEHNENAQDSGAVYVFTRTGFRWRQQAYIKASNTDAGDVFGSSVSLYEDTLVVGAAAEDSDAKGIETGIQQDKNNNHALASGAVYVFTRGEESGWVQQAYIKASNTDRNDNFGSSVSLYKDTLVVGAPFEGSDATGVNKDEGNNNANASGAVYVFTHNEESGWTQQAYVKASNTDLGDVFGSSVSLYEDTLVVGATAEDSNATGINADQNNNSSIYSGAVYVFTRDEESGWAQQAYVKASNTDAFDEFGSSVSLYKGTLVVGTVYESSNATGINHKAQNSNNAPNSGAVYVRKIAP